MFSCLFEISCYICRTTINVVMYKGGEYDETIDC